MPDLPNLASDNVIPGTELAPDPKGVAESSNAIDALFTEVTGDESAAPVVPVAPAAPAAPTAPVAPAAPAAPEAPKPPVASAPPAPPVAPVPPVTPAAPVAPVAPAPIKDKMEEVELPPYTKPKAAEAFATVKQIARQQIEAVTKEREELVVKLKAAEEKAAQVGKLPEDVEKELKELRDFRKRLDVEYDPSFKQFDTQIQQTDESILGKLKDIGVSEENLKKIRETGVGEVEWDNILAKLPPQARRFVEAKLVTREDLAEQKKRAIETAKSNADSFLADREKEEAKIAAQVTQEVQTHFTELTSKLPWFKRHTPSSAATAEEKAGAEAHNKFMDHVDSVIKDAAEDDSPETKAILTLGYVQMLQLQRETAAMRAGLDAQTKAWEAEKATLNAKIKEQSDLIDRIKRSSSSSFRSVPVVEHGATPAKPLTSESGQEALDRMRSEQLAAT